MEQIEKVLNRIEENEILNALLITLLLYVLFQTAKMVALFTLKSSKLKYTKIFSKALSKVPEISIVGLSLFFGLSSLNKSTDLKGIIEILSLASAFLFVFGIIRFVNTLIKEFTNDYLVETSGKSLKNAVQYASIIARVFVWIFLIVFTFANLGFDVSAFVAGLGISGFALAFALRNIIKDIIGSLIIITDKTIQVGDYIETSKYSGKVTSIGIKNTRVQTDDGYEAIIPNTLIVDKQVKNYKSYRVTEMDIELTFEFKRFRNIEIAQSFKTDLETNFEEEKLKVTNLRRIELGKSTNVFSLKLTFKTDHSPDLVQNLSDFIFKYFKKKKYPIELVKVL